MRNKKRQSPLKLRRAIGDRVILGLLALTMAFFSGIGCWFAFFHSTHPAGVRERIVQFVLHDAVLAVFSLCVLALIWAVAAPRWMERSLEQHAVTAYFAVLLAVLAGIISLKLG